MSIGKRKAEHISICLEQDVIFQKTSGFERYGFVHQALCDFDFSDINLETEFLGSRLRAPLLISSITGGCAEAVLLNRNLAIAAERVGAAMSCGSQKAMIRDASLDSTYFVRDVAGDILYLGNIGLDFLKTLENFARVKASLETIGADGVFVHLNLAQELAQAEGERGFAGSYESLKAFIEYMDKPVLVKEVGFGIAGSVAQRLEDAGAAAIDVAGAGGTSWTKVESYRQRETFIAKRFAEWGIPTAECLVECSGAVKLPLVASGGIYDGQAACKALALGAQLVGVAGPLLKCAQLSAEAVEEYLRNYILEMKTCMMLVGCRTPEELRGRKEEILKEI
jgi:isopentenyl-diphosphate delta-isomerase